MQIFKYLEVNPKYKMLVTTLKKSAAMLGTLVQSFVLVLIGSGQGFFMAFGVYLYSFRSFDESILGLLRMAVGDFDYSELQGAQPVLGPLMFWVYIFLVFFVLMSMFIALIAEAFEDAKEEAARQKAKHHLSFSKLKILSTKRLLQEAKVRRNLAAKSYHPDDSDESEKPTRGMGLVSDHFIRQLQPFDRAMEVFTEELERQENLATRKEEQMAVGKRKSQRQRRGSVQLELHEGESLATVIGEAMWNGEIGTWWDSSCLGRWLRSRLYWAEVQQEDKAGHVRNVADWFYDVEMKANGMEYKAKENYHAKTTKELTYFAGNIIVIVKKEKDKFDETTGRLIKKGIWKGYRKSDGAGNNRIVRNHELLEEIGVDDFDDSPVDIGDDGALSEDEDGESGNESTDETDAYEALDTILLGGEAGRDVESSSDDDAVQKGLATSKKKESGRRRVQTMFGNPAHAHMYGVDLNIPDLDSDEVDFCDDVVGYRKGSAPAPLPLALTSTDRSLESQHNMLKRQLQEANRKVEHLERKLQTAQERLNEKELACGGGGRTPEDSQMIKELYEMMSAKQKFEDRTWVAKGGMARAILEDHDKTNKIETTLKTMVQKLEAVEAAAALGCCGFSVLPSTVAEASIEDSDAPRNFVETPSTRLRRAEHKEEAINEWQRRREALQTR